MMDEMTINGFRKYVFCQQGRAFAKVTTMARSEGEANRNFRYRGWIGYTMLLSVAMANGICY